MSDPHTPDDRAALAAEHALRLLTGSDLADAEALMSSDRQFAAEVAQWRGRFAALAKEIDAADPPAGTWQRIETALGGAGAANDNLVVLERRLKRWRAIGGAMTAVAASLALALLLQPRPAQLSPTTTAPSVTAASPMVAMLGDEKAMKVVASWDPNARQLVLAVAADMPADSAHSHELWVIPQDGKPRSLGTMPAGKQMHMRLANALATLLQQGATIAISVEPRGGSKTGAPTGPVVASGALHSA